VIVIEQIGKSFDKTQKPQKNVQVHSRFSIFMRTHFTGQSKREAKFTHDLSSGGVCYRVGVIKGVGGNQAQTQRIGSNVSLKSHLNRIDRSDDGSIFDEHHCC
jgi:hypothetical protein